MLLAYKLTVPQGAIIGACIAFVGTGANLYVQGRRDERRRREDRASARDSWVRDRRAEAYIDLLEYVASLKEDVESPISDSEAIEGQRWLPPLDRIASLPNRTGIYASARIIEMTNHLLQAYESHHRVANELKELKAENEHPPRPDEELVRKVRRGVHRDELAEELERHRKSVSYLASAIQNQMRIEFKLQGDREVPVDLLRFKRFRNGHP